MGLFTEDTKIKQVPRTEGSIAGEEKLTDLIGSTPNIPTQDVAGLTPMQMAIQQGLPDMYGRITEGSKDAQDYYKSILGDNFDLESDPRYQTLMQQSGILTKQASTQAKRGAERMGMLDSSNAKDLEMTEIQKAQSPILMAIESLLGRKENERMMAAEGVGRAGAQEVGSIAAVGGIADLERIIEQMQADSLYNQALQQILFPFQYQANLANSLMNYKPDYAVEGGGLSDFGYAAQSIGSAIKSYYGAKSGGGGGMGGGGK